MAFAVSFPITFKRMIQSFGTEWAVVGNEQQHGFFEPVQIVPTRSRQSFPVFDEAFCVIRCPW
jgi:hypothetical protein